MKRSKDEDKDDVVASTLGVANNNIKLNNNASPNISSSSSSNDANNANGVSGGTAGTVRTTGRVKKPKQVYDPSDNYISRGSRSSLPTPTPAPVPAPPPAPALAPSQATRPLSPAQNNSVTQQQQHHHHHHPHQQTGYNINATEINSPSIANASANEESTDAAAMSSAEHQRNFDTCNKCNKSEPKRGSGYKSNFLACKACTLKWHFSCLPITFEILTNARKRYKCEKCRRCRVCVSGKSTDVLKDLMMCSVCANVYHLECHWPRVLPTKLNDPNWKCYSCDPSYNALDTDDDVAQIESQSPPRKSKAGRKKRATSDPAPANGKRLAVAKQLITKNGNDPADDCMDDDKPIALCNISTNATTKVPNQESETTKSIDEATESPKRQPRSPQPTSPTLELPIPIEDKENDDVTQPIVTELPEGFQQPVQTWNVDQVVCYVEKFYPQESNIFKCQEIDGAALMVLTRQDIIDRFGLKLGPALRLYELILSLQSSSDDVTLAWCD